MHFSHHMPILYFFTISILLTSFRKIQPIKAKERKKKREKERRQNLATHIKNKPIKKPNLISPTKKIPNLISFTKKTLATIRKDKEKMRVREKKEGGGERIQRKKKYKREKREEKLVIFFLAKT